MENEMQIEVLDELQGEMDDRLVSRVSKKKDAKDFTENKARPDWVPGGGSQDGIEFSEAGSEVVGSDVESEDSEYGEDEREVMESEEYEGMLG